MGTSAQVVVAMRLDQSATFSTANSVQIVLRALRAVAKGANLRFIQLKTIESAFRRQLQWLQKGVRLCVNL